MRDSSARRGPRAGRSAPASGLVVLLLLVAALAGCGGTTPRASAPTASPTPLARLRTTGIAVPRIDFCSLVPSRAARDAVGGTPTGRASYRNGQRVDLGGGADVVAETGCSWSGPGGTARAWLFATPVDQTRAQEVVDAAAKAPGCTAATTPTFGAPTSTQTCQRTGGVVRVRHAGLFGQTWLSCEVEGAPAQPEAGVRRRADAWCVQVLGALDTQR